MQKHENDSSAVAFVMAESGNEPNTSYEAVRFNAMNHGILLRLYNSNKGLIKSEYCQMISVKSLKRT